MEQSLQDDLWEWEANAAKLEKELEVCTIKASYSDEENNYQDAPVGAGFLLSSTRLRNLVQLRGGLILKLCNHILQHLLKSGIGERTGDSSDGHNKELHTHTLYNANRCSPDIRALLAVARNTSLAHWGELNDRRKLLGNQQQVRRRWQEGGKEKWEHSSRPRSPSMGDTVKQSKDQLEDNELLKISVTEVAAENSNQTLCDERTGLLIESVVNHKRHIKSLQDALTSFKDTAEIQATQAGREKVRLEETLSRVLDLERNCSALQAKTLVYATSNIALEERLLT
jgi:hypothetical protein